LENYEQSLYYYSSHVLEKLEIKLEESYAMRNWEITKDVNFEVEKKKKKERNEKMSKIMKNKEEREHKTFQTIDHHYQTLEVQQD
jgi:hypothetical protein